MQEHGVLPNDGIDRVFKNHYVIVLDDDFLFPKVASILIFREHDAIVAQVNGFPPFIPVTIIIQVLGLVVIETIFWVGPLTVLLLELVVSYLIADIVDYAGEIHVLFAQQTILFDASHIDFITQFTRLGICQLQFVDKLSKSLLLTTQSDALG